MHFGFGKIKKNVFFFIRAVGPYKIESKTSYKI